MEQLTREQALAELEQLAAIEHALIVEYLSVSCVLGHDLDAAEGGPTSPEGRDGAAAAFALAQIEMFHLAAVVRALVSVGRPVPLARASVISTAGGVQIDLGPPDVEQLPQLVDRGGAIASAVDDRYLHSYYGFLGDQVAGMISGGAVVTPEMAAQYRDGFAQAGADELIYFPCSTNVGQVDLLADAVL